MNYIGAMDRLDKYRNDKKIIDGKLIRARNTVQIMKNDVNAGSTVNGENIVGRTKALAYKSGNQTPGVAKHIKDGCDNLEISYYGKIQMATEAYENQMSAIHTEAEGIIQKGIKRSSGSDGVKIFWSIWLGALAFVSFLIMPIMGSAMDGPLFDGSSLSDVGIWLGIASIVGLILTWAPKKNRRGKERIDTLALNARELIRDYGYFILPIFTEACNEIERRYQNQLNASVAVIKAEVGENIFEIFEHVPYFQQDYFLELGRVATSEADFNSIAMECIKADKVRQQIDAQNMANAENQKAISREIERLNNAANRLYKESQYNAALIAEQNRRIAEHNEAGLREQSKVLDELKKQKKIASDLEYQIIRLEDKLDD